MEDYDEFKVRFGDRLAELLKERGISQAELARQLPGLVDPTSVSRYRRGKVLPEWPRLFAIARILDVTPGSLLAEDDR